MPLTMHSELIQAALQTRHNAYAPYSNFQVGAAILTEHGEIFTGCNVENSSFGLTICAERSAVSAMVASGSTNIAKICIASPDAAPPCGACRQVMAEFGNSFEVLLVDADSQLVKQRWKMADLLPGQFHFPPKSSAE